MFISWSQQFPPSFLINHSASDCLRNYPSSLASGGVGHLRFVSTPGIHHTDVNVRVELDMCIDGQCVPGGRTGVQATQGLLVNSINHFKSAFTSTRSRCLCHLPHPLSRAPWQWACIARSAEMVFNNRGLRLEGWEPQRCHRAS